LACGPAGPIKKNKLFFFTNFEVSRTPNSGNYSRTLMTDEARTGIFKYLDSRNQVVTVNLYQLAAAANQSLPATVRPYLTTPDPTVGAVAQPDRGLDVQAASGQPHRDLQRL
jgi:hypothetical protein